MCFWLILFCLTIVLSNGVMITQKFVFDYIPLGHSAVLITWKSNTNLNEDYSNRHFKFTLVTDADVIQTEIWTEIFTEQKRINSLEENTQYNVSIDQYVFRPDNDSTKSSELETRFPPLRLKTNPRINTSTKPAKPDFRYKFSTSLYDGSTYLRIYWLPCGRESNCHGNEVGTDFAVKFRPLDRRGDYRFESDHEFSYIDLTCLIGGIQYEVIIISILGGRETESDPQGIFVSPLCSTVTSVKIVSRLDGSVSISWKPPKYPLETLSGYLVGFTNNSDVSHNPIPLFEDTKSNSIDSMEYFDLILHETEKLFNKRKYQLIPGVIYTFIILPAGPHYAGLETRVKYTIPRSKDDL